MKKLSLSLFILLLFLPSVFAVGISPANYSVTVFSNHEHKIDFCVANSAGRNITIDFEAPGNFVEEYSFSKNNFIPEKKYDCLDLNFKTTEFKSVNESKTVGAIVITDLSDTPTLSQIKGTVFFDLSEMSYRRHATLNFGKFSLVAISIFLAGAAIIYLLSLREQHE